MVEEVDEVALRPARRRLLAAEPWADPALVEQLLDAKRTIAQALTARFFAVRVDGEVVAYVDLYHDGRTAPIEDLATLEEHRGHSSDPADERQQQRTLGFLSSSSMRRRSNSARGSTGSSGWTRRQCSR